jgi:transposase InsO family protein
LELAITQFVDYYNNRRYHESLKNLKPYDVYFGKGDKILKKRAQLKACAFNQRRKIYKKQFAI